MVLTLPKPHLAPKTEANVRNDVCSFASHVVRPSEPTENCRNLASEQAPLALVKSSATKMWQLFTGARAVKNRQSFGGNDGLQIDACECQ